MDVGLGTHRQRGDQRRGRGVSLHRHPGQASHSEGCGVRVGDSGVFPGEE